MDILVRIALKVKMDIKTGVSDVTKMLKTY